MISNRYSPVTYRAVLWAAFGISATSWSLHTYSVGTETFWLTARGLDNGMARYQLIAAVRAPGSLMPRASRSAAARVWPACRSDLDNMAPSRRSSDHSGIRGS